MKRVLEFIKITLIGGLFFIVPIVLGILILAKIDIMLRKLIVPIADKFPVESIAGIAVARIIAIIILLLLCFLAGLIAQTKLATRLKEWVEDNILSIIPGYSLLKGMGETAVGLESKGSNDVVLVDIEEVWQIGVIMDKIDDDISAVFIPGAPNPMSGDVVFVNKDRIKPLDVPVLSVMKMLKKLGLNSKEVLQGNLKSSDFSKK